MYDPTTVPRRNSRDEVAEQVRAVFDQYDNEDFDLGIKQFMLEQKVKAVSVAERSGLTPWAQHVLHEACRIRQAARLMCTAPDRSSRSAGVLKPMATKGKRASWSMRKQQIKGRRGPMRYGAVALPFRCKPRNVWPP